MRALLRFFSLAALLLVLYALLSVLRLAAAPAAQAREVALARERSRGAAGAGPRPARRDDDDAPALYTYRVVQSYPHDRTSFTQGLVVRYDTRSPPLACLWGAYLPPALR